MTLFDCGMRLSSLALGGCLLAACAGGGDETYFSTSRLGNATQPPPVNYRPEIVAAMRSYLNDPVGVRQAGISEPALKTVGGRPRYIVCLRYDARDFNGRYAGPGERAAMFLDGRLEQILPQTGDLCAGQSYAPFPELERLTR